MPPKTPECYSRVKDVVLNWEAFRATDWGRRSFDTSDITVEGVARALKLTERDVQQCFHVLNLEGILSQAYPCPRRRNCYYRLEGKA